MRPRRNILFISMAFPDCFSPVLSTYNLDLCAALAEYHRVHVISPRRWLEGVVNGRAMARYRPSPETLQSGVSVEFPTFWYVPRLAPELLGRAFWHSVHGSIKSAVQAHQPDVVMSYWAYPDGEAGFKAARGLGVPSLLIAGGSDLLLLPQEAGRGDPVRRVLRNTAMVATVSDGLRQAAIELGVPPAQARTIRQGIDKERFKQGSRGAARAALGLPGDAEVVVWVGRMVGVKNLELLLEATARLAARRPRLRLFLIGEGECRSALEAQAKRLGLAQAVTFQGPVGHEVLPLWYRAADATVLSSHSEGLPNVLRESLACGTPFVSTDVGQVHEIADARYSLLVPPGDAGKLADAMADVLHPRFREAAASYQPRSWAETASEFSDLIEELVRKKAA